MSDQTTPPSPRLDRQKRRAILKEDEQWIGKPFQFGGDPRALQANTRHMALVLSETQRLDRASRFAAFAENLLEATVAKHVKGPTACARGCSHCCTTFVSATIPEVLRLARAVRSNAARAGRVREVGERARQIPQHERETSRIVCPILEDHACS